jgi:type IV pilus assembly protein PilA
MLGIRTFSARIAAEDSARIAAEDGFTLIELLVVVQILAILAMIAIPSLLTVRGKAEAAAAKSNVSSAINAAEAYYQTNSGTSTDADSNASTTQYKGMTRTLLNNQAAGIAPTLVVNVSASGSSYCLQNTNGSSTFHYVGGLDATVVANGGVLYTGVCPSLP